MAVGRDRSGLTICIVLDMRLSLATVVTMDGVDITVDITRMFPLRVYLPYLRTVSEQ